VKKKGNGKGQAVKRSYMRSPQTALSRPTSVNKRGLIGPRKRGKYPFENGGKDAKLGFYGKKYSENRQSERAE